MNGNIESDESECWEDFFGESIQFDTLNKCAQKENLRKYMQIE